MSNKKSKNNQAQHITPNVFTWNLMEHIHGTFISYLSTFFFASSVLIQAMYIVFMFCRHPNKKRRNYDKKRKLSGITNIRITNGADKEKNLN